MTQGQSSTSVPDKYLRKYKKASPSGWSPAIQVALGIAHAYRQAIEEKQNILKGNTEKYQLWSIIDKEVQRAVEERKEDAKDQGFLKDTKDWFEQIRIDKLTKYRNTLNIPDDAPTNWWTYGINETDLEEAKQRFIQAATADQLLNYMEKVGAAPSGTNQGSKKSDSSKSAGKSKSSGAGGNWNFYRFGRKIKKVNAAIEYFGELLINFVFYGYHEETRTLLDTQKGKFVAEVGIQTATVKNKLKDQYDRLTAIAGHSNSSSQSMDTPPLTPFLSDVQQMDGPQAWERQLILVDKLTEKLHLSRTGQEFLRLATAPVKEIYEVEAVKKHLNKSPSSNKAKILDKVGLNMGFDILCLFDQTRADDQIKWKTKYDSSTGSWVNNRAIFRGPKKAPQTFTKKDGRYMLTGKYQSERAARVVQRILIGVGRTVGLSTKKNLKSLKNGTSKKEARAILGPMTSVVGMMFTDAYIEKIFNIKSSAFNNLRKTGSLKKGKRNVSGILSTTNQQDPPWYQTAIKNGSWVWGIVGTISEGIATTHEFFEALINNTGLSAKSGGTNAITAINSLKQSSRQRIKEAANSIDQNLWSERISNSIKVSTGIVGAIGSLLTGTKILMADREWKWTDIYALGNSAVGFHDSVASIDEGVRSMASKGDEAVQVRRIVSESTSRFVEFIGSIVECMVATHQAVEAYEVGDDSSTAVNAILAVTAGVGAVVAGGALILGLPIAVTAVAVVTFAISTIVGLAAWIGRSEETTFENWLKQTEFGSEVPQNPDDPFAISFKFDNNEYGVHRQVSSYLSIKLGFTVPTFRTYVKENVQSGEPHAQYPAEANLHLVDIVNGSPESTIIACPIRKDDYSLSWPGVFFPLEKPRLGDGTGDQITRLSDGSKDILQIGTPSTFLNKKALNKLRNFTPKYDGSDPSKAPGETWAWAASLEYVKPSKDKPNQFFAARTGNGRSYADTWGIEFIHVPNGISESLKTLLLNPKQRDTAEKALERLPYPRERIWIGRMPKNPQKDTLAYDGNTLEKDWKQHKQALEDYQ